MASPSTSSSTASPHPGQSAASAGAQLPGFANEKAGSLHNGSYLEPIPVTYPKIIPLEWSFPLIYQPRTETTDSGSLKNTTSAGPVPDDLPDDANTPSLSQSLSARLPVNVVADLGPATPSLAIPPVPSPANGSTIAGASQATNQMQKPWRIIWASYIVKTEEPAVGDHPASPTEPSRHGKESVRSTPHSNDFLQVPQKQASSQLPETKSPQESAVEKGNLTSRSRAGSTASRRSNDSRASAGRRHRKKRPHEGPLDQPSVSPDFLLEQYHGKEQQSQYNSAIEKILNSTQSPRLAPLFTAKKRFLNNCANSRTAESSHEMQIDSKGSALEDVLLQYGSLPQRLAFIEAGQASQASQASLPPKSSEKKEDIPRLYTFSMASPNVDISEYSGLEASAFAGLELEASGSFTASDLFPALFNDNGIYTPPSSMHPASLHPIPSAAALGPGQAPFFLSSLNISSSSNQEAVAASEAYLRAVETHVLDAIQKSYDPNDLSKEELAPDGSGTNFCRNPTYGRGVRCGHGLVYPSLANEQTSVPQNVQSASPRDQDLLALPCSPFLSCQAHFTAADLRIAVHIKNTDYAPILGADGNEPSAVKFLRKTRLQKDEDRVVLLCPTRVPAVFLRWYGEFSDTISRKQAALEQVDILEQASRFALLMEEQGSSIQHDFAKDRWALCTLGNSVKIIWPASVLLCRPHTSRRSRGATSAVASKKRKLSIRLRSAIAKVSPRVSRKLYFRPPRDRSVELAATTVTYIDLHNQEKAKNIRTKAEMQLAEQGLGSASSELHVTELSKQTQQPGAHTSNSQSLTEITELPEPSISSGNNHDGYGVAAESIQLVNEFGCPTFDTITSVLDNLLDSAADTPQPMSETRSSHGFSTVDTDPRHDNVHHRAAEGSVIYPTPQSGPNSTNQASLGPAGSADAAESTARPLSPSQNTNRSLADILGDFTWSNYTDGLAPAQQASSRPVSSGGITGGYGSRGVFDDPSTFDLFDSGGLTEEDFSFFDSPMPADMSLPQTSAAFVPQESLGLPDITADEIASFVNASGPIDHFGHLMPRSEQVNHTEPSRTENSLFSETSQSSFERSEPHQPQKLVSVQDYTDPFQYGVANSVAAHELEHPDMDQSNSHKYRAMFAGSTHGDSRQEAKVDYSRSGLPPPTISHFGPIRFLLPSPPLSEDASCHQDTHAVVRDTMSPSFDYASLRADRIRAFLSGSVPAQQSTKDLTLSKRDWQTADVPADSSSDDSLYASSETSYADWPVRKLHKPDRARSPRHVGRLPPEALIELAYSYHVPHQGARLTAALQTGPKEGPGKINRGEREAVATIFFQHTIENIDFRERRTTTTRGESVLAQLSSTSLPLNGPTLSRKLASALPTEMAAYHRNALTSVSISALQAWSKLGLRPRNGAKDVQAIVIAPKDLLDDSTRSALGYWMHRVAAAWQECGFGKHTYEPLTDCVFPLDCGASTFRESSNLQARLLDINTSIQEKISGEHNCIIYVLVHDEECAVPSSNLLYLCLRLHLVRKGAIPHIVPLSALASGSSFMPANEDQSLHNSFVKRFAFNIYDRLPACLTRQSTEKRGPNSVSALMPEAMPLGTHPLRTFVAPSFHLVSHSASQATLQLQWPPPALDVMDANRLLHIAYGFSTDRKWLYLTSIDDRAEYNCLRVRFVGGLETRAILRRVWNFMREASEWASVEWRICICRLGALYAAEVHAWCEILQNGVHQLVRPCVVTICSIVPPASSTSALSQRTRLSDQASHNGVNVTNAPAAHYADGQPLVYISHSLYPMPVYTAGDDNIDHQPSLLLKLYCALASSSLYFPASTPNYEETVDRRFPPAMAAYQIDLLVVATHPLSSYNRQLANHMADMAQSFVDLYVMARERWAMNPFSGEGSPVSHLPWHLASVASMSNFDLEALLPA